MTHHNDSFLSAHPTILTKTWIISLILLVLLSLIISEPITQNLRYHDFADQRILIGIPHALNVLSNIAFCLVGGWGIVLLHRKKAEWKKVYSIYLAIFTGVFLTGWGSAYYHWSPDNTSLVWDRLPMTLGFMAFSTLVLFERYSRTIAYRLFLPLLLLGLSSVLYWHVSGDLRPYLLVQFGPILILPILIWKSEGPGTNWLWLALCFYLLAKILELADYPILTMTGGLLSGHTLKHLAGATAALMITKKLQSQFQDNADQCRSIKQYPTP